MTLSEDKMEILKPDVLEAELRRLGYGTIIDFVSAKHDGQKRMDGSPYKNHLIRVMYRLLDWLDLDEMPQSHWSEEIYTDLVFAGVGHDLFEDTDATEGEMLHVGFSARSIDWIKFVTKPPKHLNLNKDLYALDAYERIANSGVEQVLWLKMADRFDNLDDLKNANMNFRRRYLQDTQMLISILGTSPFFKNMNKFPISLLSAKYWAECKSFYADLRSGKV